MELKILFVLRQRADHTFERSIIAEGKMFGMAKIIDMDNDGTLEVVAAMHNFPNNFFDAIFNFPKGNLKIYKPILDEESQISETSKVALFPNPIHTEANLKVIAKFNAEAVIEIIDYMGLSKYRSQVTLEKRGKSIFISCR